MPAMSSATKQPRFLPGTGLSSLVNRAVPLVLAVLAGMTAVAGAQSIDPHKLYEQRCGSCHARHAGDFVHDALVQSEGSVIGRKSGQELRGFLEAGHGKLSPDEIASMVAHLTSIQRSGRLFHNKCIICHDRAVVFARRELIVRDGELTGRYTNRNIGEFLSGHGRLKSDEVPKMIDVLKRQLSTREQ